MHGGSCPDEADMEMGNRTETREVMFKEAGKSFWRKMLLTLEVKVEVTSPGRGNDIGNVLEYYLCYSA